MLAHPIGQRIRGNQNLLASHRHTQAIHFLHIMLMATGRIVGQKVILSAGSGELVEKALHARYQLIAQINGPIHIEQKALYFTNALKIIGHSLLPPILQ